MRGRGFYPIGGEREERMIIDPCLYLAYSTGKTFEVDQVDQDRRREA
jgi:hypothetical protein